MHTLSSLPGSSPKNPVSLTDCLNLRPDCDDVASGDVAGLRPVAEPPVVATAAWRPLCAFDHRGRSMRLWHVGQVLGLSADLPEASASDSLPVEISELGTLRAEAVSADTWCDTVRVLTRTGFEYVDLAGASPAFLGPMPEMPPVRIAPMSVARLSASIGMGKLDSAPDHQGGSLAGAELRRLTTDMLHAYLSLAGNAAAQGRHLQPVLARYRILAPDGSLLHESPPVMVAAPTGLQCLGPCHFRIADASLVRPASSLSADTFVLAVDPPARLPAAWQRLAARMEVLISPQLCPVNFNGPAHAAYTYDSSAGVASMRATLPGAAADFSGRSLTMASQVELLMARLGAVMQVALSVANPFGGSLGASSCGIAPVTADARQEWQRLQAALQAPVKPGRWHLVQRFAAPHSAVPATVGNAGGVSFLADPVVTLFGGQRPSQLAAQQSSAEGTWRGAVTVQLADGSQVVAVEGGSEGAPSLLSPLIAYPLTDAVSAVVTLQQPDGTVRRCECPLRAVESEGLAYYLHPSFAPFLPDAVEAPFSTPATTAAPIPHPATVVTALGADFRRPADCVSVGHGSVKAVVQAAPAAAQLDFVRAKVFVLGSEGVSLVVADTDGMVRSSSLLDRRPVESARVVGQTSHAAWPLVAVAGRDLVKLTPTKVITLLAGVGEVDEIGWSAPFGELWLRGPAGGLPAPLRVLHAPTMLLYRRDLPARWLSQCGESLLIATDGGLLDAVREPPAGVREVDVAWQVRVDCRRLRSSGSQRSSPAAACWHGVVLDLYTPSVSGSLQLLADNGVADQAVEVGASALSGSIEAALGLPFLLPRYDFLTLSLSASAAPSMFFRSLSLF